MQFRLHSIDADSGSFVLYRSPIQARTDWAYPTHLVAELSTSVGPLISFAEAGGHVLGPEFNTETVRSFGRWLTDSVEALVERYPEWDLLFAQIHCPDSHHHALLSYICFESPHFAGEGSEQERLLLDAYRAADEVLGRCFAIAKRHDAAVAVVSDHGGAPFWRTVWLAGALRDAGLLRFRYDEATECYHTDFAETRACPFYCSEHMFVNLKGRDPEGIVAPGREYDEVRTRIIRVLDELRDPRTGESPFSWLGMREEARGFGLEGDRIGDVIYFLKPGYANPFAALQQNVYRTGIYEKLDGEGVFSDVGPRAGHSFAPTARMDPATNMAVFALAGEGVQRGYRRSAPICLEDVMVTICSYLGMDPPAQADGRVARDLFS
jgi:hypothetical protein